MEEVKQILQQYELGNQEVLNYESHSHDPDMWSHTFESNDKKYLLVEVEAVDDDLEAEEYEQLEDDLDIKRADLKLVTPKLEQMYTMNNRDGIGVDGHSGIINADDTSNREPKKYKNPYGLQSETTWILFEMHASANNLLTEDEAKRVEQGEALDKDYFYLPVIYYGERTPDDDEDWYSLRFNNQEPPASLLAYASKVPAGQTLWQAVRHDLEVDFHYSRPKSFVTEEAKPFDTAKTKDGRELTRILVWIGVYEKFDTTGINPIDTHPFWVYEGEDTFNPINKYFE